jgi:hypothetical protein
MFHEVCHFVLVTGVRLASSILPAAPLLGQKLPSASVVKNIEGMLEDIAEGLPMAERKLALAVQGRAMARCLTKS